MRDTGKQGFRLRSFCPSAGLSVRHLLKQVAFIMAMAGDDHESDANSYLLLTRKKVSIHPLNKEIV